MSTNFQGSFRSLKVLSYLAMSALGLVGIANFVSAALGVGQIVNPVMVVHLHTGETVSIWELLQGLNALFMLLGLLGSWVLFLVWLNRAYKNLAALKPQYLEFSSGWAVGWWFVPFANLIKPFQVVREVWWESDPDRSDELQFLTVSLHRAPSYMGLWWSAWLVSDFLGYFTSLHDAETNRIETIAMTGYFFILSGITTVVAAGLAIFVVFDVTRRQEARSQKLAREEFHFPPDGLS
jgi:hypothetical protein